MNTPAFDAVIIGSGAGGAAAAYRLVRAGMRVALLEKGPRLPRDGSTLDIRRVVHQGEFLSRENWRDGAGREFAPEEHFNLGGKTKWYGAALLRFGEQEFAPDPEHGCLGWPIDCAALKPFYDEAEELLEVRQFPIEPGLQRIVSRVTRPSSAWTATPMPMGLAGGILRDAAEAAHFDGFASVRALKSDAEQSLLARVLGDPRLTLLTDTEVVDLVGDPRHPSRIVGVRTSDDKQVLGTRVLLAAGALHSPRLLERYLTRAKLIDALPVARTVGRNLKLHLLTAMVAVSHRKQSDLLRKTTVLTNERYPHSSVQPLGFDAELIATLIPKLVPRALASEIGKRAYGFFLQTEDGSTPDNRVLDGAAVAPPMMDYDARRTAPALREHRQFTHGFQRALLGAGFVSFTQRIGLAGTAHACGTLVAGHDPAHAVVDAQGAVFGMPGLYVVDGSALPRSSRVNPSLTIYAWALRVAQLIADRANAEMSTENTNKSQSKVNHETV